MEFELHGDEPFAVANAAVVGPKQVGAFLIELATATEQHVRLRAVQEYFNRRPDVGGKHTLEALTVSRGAWAGTTQ
ncbi:MAG: hypothetical protein ACT4QD_08280 [Acidobacteriota bacterium]